MNAPQLHWTKVEKEQKSKEIHLISLFCVCVFVSDLNAEFV